MRREPVPAPGPRPAASRGVVGVRVVWPLYLGMAVAGSAAVVASASTLAALARVAGWAGWTPWLLPAALDVGGSVGGWCWLRPGTPSRARDFGRAVALVGAAGTLVGNAAGHLIASRYLHPGPGLVVIVGAVPAAVLVALVHLAALLTATDPPPRPAPSRAARHIQPPTAAPERPAPQPTTTPPPPAAAVRDVVLGLLDQAPATVAELVRVSGRPRSTVVGQLRVLTEAGLVARDETKRYRRLPRPVTGEVA
ncbi:MAG: helix-turn-helix domain-containing protein [Kineosporiaceae bacterium]|nr:helix-turn-helix domain-containing protein [Kineosporiaceae bacterium]